MIEKAFENLDPKAEKRIKELTDEAERLALLHVSCICISCGTKTKGQSLCDVCNARGLDAYE